VKASIENANLRDDTSEIAHALAVTAQMSADISQLPQEVPASMRTDFANAAVEARKTLHEGNRPEAIAALGRIQRIIRYAR